ncbi:MAG: type II secretion system F family protein [Gemmataceae bacterium]|nr:type II secretion system F family protein [Gemmataceae bacterium]
MPDYSYTALASTGQRSQGIITATSEREALTILDQRGLYPVSIKTARASGARGGSRKRIRPRQMATFYSQLADLLRTGVPLLRSLDILERQAANPNLGAVVREVRAKVADGTSLADAMNQHPRAFTELAISMVRAGQEGGFLEDVLKRIADFTEQQEDLKSRVVGALAYPIFLAVTGFIVLNVLVIFFVPQFKPIFTKLEEQGELPWLTRALMDSSHFMQNYWMVLIGGIVLAIVLYKSWARSESGRMTMDRVRLRLPQAGTIYLNLALSRFTRILGTLMHNGIPILQALKIAKDSTGNRVLTQAIDQAAQNVTEGNKLAAPFTACPYFPRDVVEMVAVGEESNSLETVLLDIANSLEKRTTRQLDLFVRLLEPLMLLVMAGVTLVVVAGLLLPVFKMSQTVQQ